MISVLLTSWKGLGLPRQLPNPIGVLRDSLSQIWENLDSRPQSKITRGPPPTKYIPGRAELTRSFDSILGLWWFGSSGPGPALARLPSPSLSPTMTLPVSGPVTQTPSYRAARPDIVGTEIPENPFPIYLSGKVQKGFGRGGKDLGCPTGQFYLREIPAPRLTLTEQLICQTSRSLRWWKSRHRVYTSVTPRSLPAIPTAHLRTRSTRDVTGSTQWS